MFCQHCHPSVASDDADIRPIFNRGMLPGFTCATFLRRNFVYISNRRIADVCFELHFRVTPGQFRSAAASSLHRRLALLATSIRPSFSKNAYLGILFAVYPKNFHDSSDICPMGLMYSIEIRQISHRTFGPSHRKCPTCPMIFVNTVFATMHQKYSLDFVSFGFYSNIKIV